MPSVLDRFGRCAACGRREDCCETCHRGHDHAWDLYERIPNLPINKMRGASYEDRERTVLANRRATLLRQLEELEAR